MAEKANKVEAGAEVKTPEVEVKKEVSAAPAGEKPVETPTPGASEAPTEDEFSNVITILNEIQAMNGGKGDIKSLPPEIAGEIKFIVEKMVALRDAFADPLFKPVLDDMVDQAEDGKTPSLLVAVARNVPMEQLQDLADNENYADVQGAVDERIASDKSEAEAEETLFGNFEESQAAGEAYAEKMGYDETEKQELFSTAMAWFEVLGDGKITEAEWEKVDKERNYDRDTEDLRKQIPEVPKKEMLPDQSSMAATMAETPKPATTPKPRNSIEALGNVASTGFEDVGKRRFMKK